MRRIRVAAVGVFALSGVACGDDGDTSDDGAATSEAGSSSGMATGSEAPSTSAGTTEAMDASGPEPTPPPGSITNVTSASDTAETDACAMIDGRTYASMEEMECGLAPEGTVTCNWTIAFSAGEYAWAYSDVEESGTYSCDAFVIFGLGPGDVQYTGTLDFETGVLTWEGVEYLPDA